MASLLCLVDIFIFIITTETFAQVANVPLQVGNSTRVELPVNLTSSVKPGLPPGGLPEIIVNPALKQELPPEGVPGTILNPAVKIDIPKGLPGGITNPVEIITTLPVPEPAWKILDEDPVIAEKRMNVGEGKTPLVVDPDTIPTKVLGSRCMGPKDCLTINNTSCISGICDCISGFIPSKRSLDRCIKVPTGLGDECEEEAQCAHVVPGSECRSGKCFCPPNFILDLGRCWENQLLGGMCNTSMQCENVALSICAQEVCACQPPLIPSPNSNKCLQSAGTVYRAPCEEDIQCTDSYGDEAHCSNSQCICTNNYHFNGSTCLADRKLGDICVSDEDCAVSDVSNVEGSRACVSQHCGCANGFATLNGEDTCYVMKSSGEELAVSFTWFLCIVIAKYYLS